jgi:hypothetical protein
MRFFAAADWLGGGKRAGSAAAVEGEPLTQTADCDASDCSEVPPPPLADAEAAASISKRI